MIGVPLCEVIVTPVLDNADMYAGAPVAPVAPSVTMGELSVYALEKVPVTPLVEA
jgi:hypothetical protein